MAIARLDKLSRNEDVQEKLKAPDARWDLIVCDEAHKMSATAFGGEVSYTKRYRLGQLLSTLTRHFLLMTATPHNGKQTASQRRKEHQSHPHPAEHAKDKSFDGSGFTGQPAVGIAKQESEHDRAVHERKRPRDQRIDETTEQLAQRLLQLMVGLKGRQPAHVGLQQHEAGVGSASAQPGEYRPPDPVSVHGNAKSLWRSKPLTCPNRKPMRWSK